MLSLAVSCFQTFYPLDYHIFSTALVMTGNIYKICNILNVFISEASRRVWTSTIRVTLATPWPLVVCTLRITGATARTWSVYVATMGCQGRTCRGAEWRTRKTYNSKTIFIPLVNEVVKWILVSPWLSFCLSVEKELRHHNSFTFWHIMMVLHKCVVHDYWFCGQEIKNLRSNLEFVLASFLQHNTFTRRHMLLILHTYVAHEPRQTPIDFRVKRSQVRIKHGSLNLSSFQHLAL